MFDIFNDIDNCPVSTISEASNSINKNEIPARLAVLASDVHDEAGRGAALLLGRPLEQGQPADSVPLLRPAGGLQEALQGLQLAQVPEPHKRRAPEVFLQAVQARAPDAAEHHQEGDRHQGNRRLPEGVHADLRQQRGREGTLVFLRSHGRERL